MDNLDIIASALDAAWDQLTCICNDGGVKDSGICDCAIAQVGEALDLLRVKADRRHTHDC